METFRKYVGTVGFVLALVAIVLAFWFNHDQNARTQESLHATQASSCQRQHDSSEQWHGVMQIIEDQTRAVHPDQPLPQGLVDFERKVFAVVDQFPACKLARS